MWICNILFLGRKTKLHVGTRVLQQSVGDFSLKAPTDSVAQSNSNAAALPIAIYITANIGNKYD